jgi:hypothetical protein
MVGWQLNEITGEYITIIVDLEKETEVMLVKQYISKSATQPLEVRISYSRKLSDFTYIGSARSYELGNTQANVWMLNTNTIKTRFIKIDIVPPSQGIFLTNEIQIRDEILSSVEYSTWSDVKRR